MTAHSPSLHRLALFDLDHTLLPFDSDYAWVQFTATLGWAETDELNRRNDAFYRAYQAGTLDIHDYVRFATASVVARGASESQAAHQAFMQRIVLPQLRPQAVDLVLGHQRAGDAVVIVTATNEFVTRPIAAAFGVTELIAIELVRDPASGWFTGEIAGTPSFREGKVARVQAWLQQRGWSWGDTDITFYSDSSNDVPLLERVQHPVATNPDAPLRALATSRQWRILDLFQEGPSA